MQDNNTSVFKVRLNAYRPLGESYEDLYGVVKETFSLYSKIEKIIGPYNARQLNSNMPYSAPSKDYLTQLVNLKSFKSLNSVLTASMIWSAIKFCEKYKGRKQLISPHQSTHHSAHFPEGMFEIEPFSVEQWQSVSSKSYPVTSVHKITLDGCNPIFVENMKMDKFKYVIVRQRMGKTGIPTTTSWEVLLFKHNPGFMIEHADAELNPRYAGII